MNDLNMELKAGRDQGSGRMWKQEEASLHREPRPKQQGLEGELGGASSDLATPAPKVLRLAPGVGSADNGIDGSIWEEPRI